MLLLSFLSLSESFGHILEHKQKSFKFYDFASSCFGPLLHVLLYTYLNTNSLPKAIGEVMKALNMPAVF